MNKTEAINAPLAELEKRSWELLTNVKFCGGASREGRRVVQRRLRAVGWRFYLRLFSTETDDGPVRWNKWGMVRPGHPLPYDEAKVVDEVVGVSLNNCAHKLGSGNANEGWRIYHNW